MAQDYKLLKFDPGLENPFKDQNGNLWTTAVFEGIQEEVKWVVKDPSKIQEGNSYYGEVKKATSKAGKDYLRFYREQKPDFQSSQQGTFAGGAGSNPYTGSSKPAYKDNSDGQRQGMCFNNAANYVNIMHKEGLLDAEAWASRVHTYANALYKLGDLGRDGGSTSEALKVRGNPNLTSSVKQFPTTSRPETTEDAEAGSLYQTFAGAEEVPPEEYDMSQIPF